MGRSRKTQTILASSLSLACTFFGAIPEKALAQDSGTPPAQPAHPLQGLGRPDESNPPSGAPPAGAPSGAPPAGTSPATTPPTGGTAPAGEVTPSGAGTGGSSSPPTSATTPGGAGGDDKSGSSDNDNDKDDKAGGSNSDDNSASTPPSSSAKEKYDPLKEAMFLLHRKEYTQCLSKLNAIIANNPQYSQAHYIKGVVYVMLRQYYNAAAEYREVIKLSPNSDLGRRAQDGLKKIIGSG